VSFKKKVALFWVPFEAQKILQSSNFFFRPFVVVFVFFLTANLWQDFSSFFTSVFFVGLHSFFLQILLFLTLSFCCCRALVVVVVVVFVLCGLNPLLSSVLWNTIYNNNVRNIRVLELRGAENEEGNRGEVTRWFETIGISRVRFRRVCHGR
tara:strand:- start:934 stop:1389 length:456 start_codon:yes stop_codon:yes gene_type:complete